MNMKRIVLPLLCVALFFGLAQTAAYADDKDFSSMEKQPVVKLDNDAADKIKTDRFLKQQTDVTKGSGLSIKLRKNTLVDDDEAGDYIWWNRSNNFTVYKGEKLYVDFTMWDTWESWFTIPSFDVVDGNFNTLYECNPAGSYMVVEPDSWDRYAWHESIGSSRLAAGSYYLVIYAMPCDVYGWWADDWKDFDIPIEIIPFKVKSLPSPTKVKAKAGKKRVTVTFKKSTGAKKYEIYRSLKKNSGYKKIKTITGSKFVDKKVKKGKKYYYKVKAVRGTSNTGIARSALTKPVRSGKVRK